MKRLAFILLFCCPWAFGQKITSWDLNEELEEISGIEYLNDTTLVAINDGGNSNELFLLDLEGKIVRKVEITGALNTDWEDITRDKHHLYIGDFGNNKNGRKDLRILKVKVSEVLNQDQVGFEEIQFNYADQSAFPPNRDSLFYDAEGLAANGDSLYVFTKDRSDPSIGNSHVYVLPKTPGSYEIKVRYRLNLGTGGFWTDAVTAADYCSGYFYLSTYTRIIIFEFKGSKFKKKKEIEFDEFSQKESLVVGPERQFYYADERQHLLGGGKLYNHKRK